MNKPFKKLVIGIFLVVIFCLALYIPARAFWPDLNPLTFLSRATDVIERRVSDLVYYLIMQKRYIFDNYEDPNNLLSISVPDVIEKKVIPVVNTSVPNKATTTKKTSVSATSTSLVNKQATPVTNLLVPVVPVNIITPPVSETNKNIENNINSSPILLLTNKERANNQLMSLCSNSILDQIASLRADDILDNQYFEHESLDGKTASGLADKLGYGYLLIGENLAMGNFADDADIVKAWMESPGHRANILNGKFNELGVSVKEGVFDGNKITIAVQIFADPLASCAKPNKNTKKMIDSSSASITQMQKEALIMYNSLNTIKGIPGVDQAYYSQKVQEYNYFAKKINDSVLALKNMIDLYNVEVANYNLCIKN